LRALLAERGAQWCEQLLEVAAVANPRMPLASEVTLVDVPGEARGGDDVNADKA